MHTMILWCILWYLWSTNLIRRISVAQNITRNMIFGQLNCKIICCIMAAQDALLLEPLQCELHWSFRIGFLKNETYTVMEYLDNTYQSISKYPYKTNTFVHSFMNYVPLLMETKVHCLLYAVKLNQVK